MGAMYRDAMAGADPGPPHRFQSLARSEYCSLRIDSSHDRANVELGPRS